MVKKYLEELYQEYYENKLNLEQELQRKKLELNSNIEFVHTLKKSLDENFESFSPIKIDEDKHVEIDLLLEEQSNISKTINELQIEISGIDVKMLELKKVIENFYATQEHFEILLKQNDEKLGNALSENGKYILVVNEIQNVILPNLTTIYHKIEMCNNLAKVDLVRCKLELQEVENNMKTIIQKLDEIKCFT